MLSMERITTTIRCKLDVWLWICISNDRVHRDDSILWEDKLFTLTIFSRTDNHIRDGVPSVVCNGPILSSNFLLGFKIELCKEQTIILTKIIVDLFRSISNRGVMVKWVQSVVLQWTTRKNSNGKNARFLLATNSVHHIPIVISPNVHMMMMLQVSSTGSVKKGWEKKLCTSFSS